MAKTSTVTIPQKLTATGTPEASQGVSMADLIAQQVQAAVAAMIANGVIPASSPASPASSSGNGGMQVQQPATVAGPKASKKASKTSASPAVNVGLPGSGKLGKLGSTATSVKPVVESEDSERFDARRYFSLNPQMDLVRLDESTYIGRSTDEKYSKNPIAIVGVQRKTMMLSEAKCMVLFEMLKAVCSE